LVVETGDIFGQVLASLEKHGVADNTLVIFTSDNGVCILHWSIRRWSGKVAKRQWNYRAIIRVGPIEGYKSDAWDGGHRIPCIDHWPGVIEPGTKCDELVCLSDLMVTCAEIVRNTLPDNAGENSVGMLPLFRQAGLSGRKNVAHH